MGQNFVRSLSNSSGSVATLIFYCDTFGADFLDVPLQQRAWVLQEH